MILCAITGPTASGKTELALKLAEKHKAELICADSRQVYKSFCIGTAQATQEEQERIPHHLVDFLNPEEGFSAGDFTRTVNDLLISDPDKKFVIVGGTGFYLKSLKEGMPGIPDISQEVKDRVAECCKEKSLAQMHAEIESFDLFTYKRLYPTDTHRICRAYEVYWQTQKPWSEFLSMPKKGAIEFPIYNLIKDRAELYERINLRTHQMIEEGWCQEISGLLESGISDQSKAMQTLGYPQLLKSMRGETNQEEAILEIQQQTRRYAKRQISFFKNQINCIETTPEELIGQSFIL